MLSIFIWSVKILGLFLQWANPVDVLGFLKKCGVWCEGGNHVDLAYAGVALGILGCLALVLLLVAVGFLLCTIFWGIKACWAGRPTSIAEWCTADRFSICRDVTYPFLLALWFIFWYYIWSVGRGGSNPVWVSWFYLFMGCLHLWFILISNPVWYCIVAHVVWTCLWCKVFWYLEIVMGFPSVINVTTCICLCGNGFIGLADTRVKAFKQLRVKWRGYRAACSRVWANMSWKRNGGNKGS